MARGRGGRAGKERAEAGDQAEGQAGGGSSLYAQHGAGAISRRRVAAWRAGTETCLERLYPEAAGLLMGVLGEHVWGLNAAVCEAFDSGAACGPRARLEAVVRAWMERVSAEPDEHRSLLFCAHLLPDELRRQVALKYRGVLETVMEAVCAAVPGLSGRAAAVESLLGSARASLSDAGRWREPVSAEEQGRVARRIAGMLIAAGEAEMIGGWEGMGGLAGVGAGGVQVAESHLVRKRFSTVMDMVEAGGEVVVTRRGKRVAKVVGVRVIGGDLARCTTGQFGARSVVQRGGLGRRQLYNGAVWGGVGCTTGAVWGGWVPSTDSLSSAFPLPRVTEYCCALTARGSGRGRSPS